MNSNMVWRLALCALAVGCNSLDGSGTGIDSDCLDCGGTTRVKRTIPTDTRAAAISEVPPPPVSGGTLLTTRDGTRAVVADPDRDRVVVVNLETLSVAATLTLAPRDEPGRLVEAPNGRVHVGLRGSGDVLTVDPAQGVVVARTAVCGEPRGLAVDATNGRLFVACAEGVLAELVDGAVVRRTTLQPDLRDVVVRGQDVFVSRFRSAELLKLDRERNVASLLRAPAVWMSRTDRTGSPSVQAFQAGTAWRMLPTAQGAIVLHQLASSAVLDIDPSDDDPNAGSPYGGARNCEAIVQPGMTEIVTGDALRTSGAIVAGALAVDFAISPDKTAIAIANAGPRDMAAPIPTVEFQTFGPGGGVSGGGMAPSIPSGGSVSVFMQNHLWTEGGCLSLSTQIPLEQPVIAVAFDKRSRLLAQTREPSQLAVVAVVNASTSITWIDLGGESRADTGHDLFHRDGGAGIACASCHPEGGEDGRVWNFKTIGVRRTQPLNVGLGDTAPFHWDGELETVGELMAEVFVERMGGVFESPERTQALEHFLFSLRTPKPLRTADDPAVVRGKINFESGEVGCANCHNGHRFTDNRTVDIGKGRPLQVPSLIGIARRAPFLHDGCASNLRTRFNAECGGSAHGDVSGLSETDLGDLVAYLESL
jgi:hypothetical protein